MTSLSERLLAEINQNENSEDFNSDDESDEVIDIQNDKIQVNYLYIPGLREGSQIVWTPEERNLYYVNSYSKKTGIIACTCYEKNCSARLFIKNDESAFRYRSKPHDVHCTHYEAFMLMHCFNKIKQKTRSAPASMFSSDIYDEVVKEYVYSFFYWVFSKIFAIHFKHSIH